MKAISEASEGRSAMILEGSCHCGAVRFSLNSRTSYPYMRCYCSICRKTAGGGGYAINIMGEASTHCVEGEDQVNVYRVRRGDDTVSTAHRYFCRICGSTLWVSDPAWPDLVHPFASAIDTELPQPPESVHIMVGSAPSWVEVAPRAEDSRYREYPEDSIEAWHQTRGLTVE
jgi:hypothetical protein